MRRLMTWLWLLLLGVVPLGLTGCPERDTGETIEEAGEEAGEAVEEAGDEIEDAVE